MRQEQPGAGRVGGFFSLSAEGTVTHRPSFGARQPKPFKPLPLESRLAAWFERNLGALHFTLEGFSDRALEAFKIAFADARESLAAAFRRDSVAPRPLLVPARPLPVPGSLAAEGRETLVRFLAYAGGIGAMSFFAAHILQSPPVEAAVEPQQKPEWTSVAKPYPAFLLSLPDLGEEQRYTILRHADGGGRKDIMTFGELGRSLRYVMVEVYRPGTEIESFGTPSAEIAARAADLQPAGMVRPSLPIKSKFGTFSTVEFAAGRFGIGHCIGFVRSVDDPRLQISGISCSMDHLVNRSAVACALDRLSLMSAGSDPDIARYFAQSEIKRNFCGQRDPLLYATPKRDYPVTPPSALKLRGRLSAR